jgi:hypothetical protein
MVATCSSETSVGFQQTAQHYVPKRWNSSLENIDFLNPFYCRPPLFTSFMNLYKPNFYMFSSFPCVIMRPSQPPFYAEASHRAAFFISSYFCLDSSCFLLNLKLVKNIYYIGKLITHKNIQTVYIPVVTHI